MLHLESLQGDAATAIRGTSVLGRVGSGATSQNGSRRMRKMRSCCCLDVSGVFSLPVEASPLEPWPSRPVPREVGHRLSASFAAEASSSSFKNRSNTDSNMNSKHCRPHLPPPPPPTCSPHPKLQERKFPIKQTRHHHLYGARTAAPIYQFSHLSLKPYEHIDDYRRSCSSVSSIQQQQDQQEQPPHHQPTSNGLPLKKTVATPSVVQMVKERPPERPSADINCIVFDCPTRHDASLLYRPLLFARGSGQPSNASSRLLAEYWSSAASTVESMMKMRGSCHAIGSSIFKNGEVSREDIKEEIPHQASHSKHHLVERPSFQQMERRFKERLTAMKEDKGISGSEGGQFELQVESMTLNESRFSCHSGVSCHSGDFKSQNSSFSSTSSSNPHSPEIRSRADTQSCSINESKTDAESKTESKSNPESKSGSANDQVIINHCNQDQQGLSQLTRVEYPIFVAEEACNVVSNSTSNSTSSSFPLSSLKRPIPNNVYSNPFEYSREDECITHRASGRLLAGRMRAISDSGVSGEGEDIIGDSLQSRSLFKSNCTTGGGGRGGGGGGGVVHRVTEEQGGYVPPTSSLPNFLNIAFSHHSSLANPSPSLQSNNRDLLYVGVDPRPNSATSHETIPQSVSARVKHRLTLCSSSPPPPLPPPPNTSPGTGKKRPKTRHVRYCFKKSLNRRILSSSRWMIVENSSSAKGSRTLPTLDDIVNAE